MKQLTINGTMLGFVEVPEDAIVFGGMLNGFLEYGSNGKWCAVELPSGLYTFLFKASECTEEQAKEMVQKFHYGGYFDYENAYGNSFDPANDTLPLVLSATESIYSLIRSLGMEPGTTVILKQVK